jgi:hypothetical protein
MLLYRERKVEVVDEQEDRLRQALNDKTRFLRI